MVMQTLHLVPDYRVMKQVEVIADELADQFDRITLEHVKLFCT